MANRLPLTAAADGLRLAVRLTPKAAAERIAGIAEEADGSRVLKVAVNAPPEDGKANEALLRLLARLLKVPRRDLAITLGATQRRKLIHIAGDPALLLRKIGEELKPWLKQE